LVSGATYIARGFSGEQEHLTNLIAQGIQHKGFALIDVFSPCVTYNKHNTYPWFKERVYKLEDTEYDTSDYDAAMLKVREWGEQIPIGLCYQVQRPTYEDGEPALKQGPLVRHKLGLTQEQGQALLRDFM
jgi:2-oxoglutarate ferredoxin oxidoreductase subunit beta